MSTLKKTFLNSKNGITDLENKIESLTNQVNNKEKTARKAQSSLPKQLLILYYLGQLNNFDLSNSKNAILLSVLLNGNEQNIRKDLSDFIDNQLRSKSALTHLNEIKLLFEEIGLKELLQKVENDIVRVKERKL